MRIPWNPNTTPYHSLRRWLVHPVAWALFFLSPTLNILRVDMTTQEVIYFGHAFEFGIGSLAPIPIGFYATVIAIAVITAFYGRLFCGWACPHNIMSENTRFFRGAAGIEPMPRRLSLFVKRFPKIKPALPWLSIGLGVLFSFGMTFLLFHYVVPWSVLIDGYLTGSVSPALWMGQLLFTLIGLFLLFSGHHFCRSACPYGMAQSASAYQGGKRRPLEINYTGNRANKAEDCGTCNACQQICPVDIDPRSDEVGSILKVGEFWGCWNCGECIDACSTVMGYRQQPTLLEFKGISRSNDTVA